MSMMILSICSLKPTTRLIWNRWQVVSVEILKTELVFMRLWSFTTLMTIEVNGIFWNAN